MSSQPGGRGGARGGGGQSRGKARGGARGHMNQSHCYQQQRHNQSRGEGNAWQQKLHRQPPQSHAQGRQPQPGSQQQQQQSGPQHQQHLPQQQLQQPPQQQQQQSQQESEQQSQQQSQQESNQAQQWMGSYPGYGMSPEAMGHTPMLYVDNFNQDVQAQGQTPPYMMMIPPQMGDGSNGANMGYQSNMSPQALYEAASAAAAMYSDPQQQQYVMQNMMMQPNMLGQQMQVMSIDPRMSGGHHHGRHHGHYWGHRQRPTHDGVDISDLLPDPKAVPWEQIKSRAVPLAFEKLGSMALQANLTKDVDGQQVPDVETIDEMLTSLVTVFDRAMQDRYGSHLTRSLAKICTPEQRLGIWQCIQTKLVDLATNHFGKWTVQELVKGSRTDAEFLAFQKCLTVEDIFVLSKDRNGAHVLKTCAFEMKPEVTQFIYEAVAADIMRLARHKFGCATLQRCLEAGTTEQILLLANAISIHSRELAVDGHGNYILQYVVAMKDGDSKAPSLYPAQLDVVKALEGNFLYLSKHKFGSNVVEKIISMGSSGDGVDRNGPGSPLSIVLGELLVEGGLERLLDDPFANYVVQGAIKHCDLVSDALASLREQIGDYDRHHQGWSTTVTGRRIIQKLMKRWGQRMKKLNREQLQKEETEKAAAAAAAAAAGPLPGVAGDDATLNSLGGNDASDPVTSDAVLHAVAVVDADAEPRAKPGP